MLRGIDGLSDTGVGGVALRRGAAWGLVSRARASICGGGKEEDAGRAARDVVGACAVSTRLSIDEKMEGGGGDEAFGRIDGVVEAAVW